MSLKPNKLDQLRQRLKGKSGGDEVTSIYFLIKELKCLPDIIGREFEVVYEGDKIKKIIQKPMSIPSFMILLNEMKEDYKRQEREMKKSKLKKGKR